jgi:hypothetical protein
MEDALRERLMAADHEPDDDRTNDDSSDGCDCLPHRSVRRSPFATSNVWAEPGRLWTRCMKSSDLFSHHYEPQPFSNDDSYAEPVQAPTFPDRRQTDSFAAEPSSS